MTVVTEDGKNFHAKIAAVFTVGNRFACDCSLVDS